MRISPDAPVCLGDGSGGREGRPYSRPVSDGSWLVCFRIPDHPIIINRRTSAMTRWLNRAESAVSSVAVDCLVVHF